MPAGAEPHVIAVIPARLASTRLPGKVLRLIAGQPMLAWVYEAARACEKLDDVLIATDSQQVMDLAGERGWKAMMTPAECASGTDRIYWVAQRVAADIYVNVQGDEPLLRPEHIDSLLRPVVAGEADVSTLATRCSAVEVGDPNVVKVVVAASGRALYFSRAAIPYDRDGGAAFRYLKHLGFYAYRRAALKRFPGLAASSLEVTERLEQLRFLENGVDVQVEMTPFDTVGVDTEEDLRVVEGILLGRSKR